MEADWIFMRRRRQPTTFKQISINDDLQKDTLTETKLFEELSNTVQLNNDWLYKYNWPFHCFKQYIKHVLVDLDAVCNHPISGLFWQNLHVYKKYHWSLTSVIQKKYIFQKANNS